MAIVETPLDILRDAIAVGYSVQILLWAVIVY
jgi:hypothetical protein